MGHVHWLMENEIRAGQVEEFQTLMREMVAATRDNEPGTLAYEWHTNPEMTACSLYERYEDSAAAMIHLGNFGPFAKRFRSVMRRTRLTILGSPGQDVLEALASADPTVLTIADGFSR